MDRYMLLEEVNKLKAQYEAEMLYESLGGEDHCRGAITALNKVLKLIVENFFICYKDESWQDCMKRYEVDHKEWMMKYSDFNPSGEGTWRSDD